MRYRRGSISISDQFDLPVLRTVYSAGHLTFEQLYEFQYPINEKRLRDTLCWRVRRLVEHKLLDQTVLAGLNGVVLSLGELGELYLQGKESIHVERATRSRGSGKRNQLWHDVELCGIHLALRRTGVVASWESEPEIRAVNNFTMNHYAKDYDAVVTFQAGSKRGRWALEYERTPKWSKEYERILALLRYEKSVDGFLYLVRSFEVYGFLLHALRNAVGRMFVAMAPAFAQDPLHANLIDVRSQLSCRLEDCLRTRCDIGPD